MSSYCVETHPADEAFADLAVRYEADGRYYHTLAHIRNVLETLESLRSFARDFRAVQLAAWFHDVIYDARALDNEEQSAQYARQVLQRLRLPSATIDSVVRMIRATTHRPPYPTDLDCQILLDADLATFASEWAQQEIIEQAIRREYAFVPDDVYRPGRRQVLRQFLDRERIYYTEPMYAAREEKARHNIARAIAALSD